MINKEEKINIEIYKRSCIQCLQQQLSEINKKYIDLYKIYGLFITNDLEIGCLNEREEYIKKLKIDENKFWNTYFEIKNKIEYLENKEKENKSINKTNIKREIPKCIRKTGIRKKKEKVKFA